ncbi:hypothetical protein V5O48_009107 [Marasmius crinis-equi]|uniref:F-box domain-containing protein n=1 Tax=Marasmius crinis-equi TaxID=585013 RepID=A0ABR3FCP9_9AGAR
MTIDSLPPEILLQIYQAASEDIYEERNPVLPSTVLTCSKVCQRWRALVLDAPALFSQIFIPFKLLREQQYDVRKWARFWLERSQSHPVSIIIQLYYGDAGELETFHSLLHDCVRPNIARIRDLHFTFVEKGEPHNLVSLFYPLLDDGRLDAPILEELTVRYLGGAGRPIILLTPSSFRNFLFTSHPKLHRLTIRGIDTPSPFHSLTHLDLHYVDLGPESFRKLVKDCPELHTLALRAIRIPIPSFHDSSEPIVMAHLRTLILEFGRALLHDLMDDPKRVLAYVVAPNLESLEVIAGGLPISLANILPNPKFLTSLRRLKLDSISKTVENLFTSRVANNSHWFVDLPDTIEELHLSHSTGDVLGIELHAPQSQLNAQHSFGDDLTLPSSPNGPAPPRTRSKDVHALGANRNYDSFVLSGPPMELSSAAFTNLVSLTIDSIRAEEMLWLCRVLAVRPHIRDVTLSQAAYRSLRSSLVLSATQDGSWKVRLKMPGFMSHRWDYEDEDGADVVEWVKERVELSVLTRV